MKLFLSIIDMKDKEKYERKYLKGIRRIVRDYQIVKTILKLLKLRH